MIRCSLTPARRPFAWLACLLLAGCRASARPDHGVQAGAGRDLTPTAAVPEVSDATVIAFWLAGTDTLPPADREQIRDEFRHSNQLVAGYLEDTDIGLIATLNDTLVVRLAGGRRRMVMLSGLDYPYGYVLVEPGYAEEFHTGMDGLDDLELAIDTYFGLEDDDKGPQHRIAEGLDSLPDPTRADPRHWRPRVTPACASGAARAAPYTRWHAIATGTRWGCSKAGRPARVAARRTAIFR